MRLRSTVLTVGVLLFPAITARSADPPFPDSISLIGSSVYNATDWDVNAGGGGSIAMDTLENGLKYTPDKSVTDKTVRHQHLGATRALLRPGWGGGTQPRVEFAAGERNPW